MRGGGKILPRCSPSASTLPFRDSHFRGYLCAGLLFQHIRTHPSAQGPGYAVIQNNTGRRQTMKAEMRGCDIDNRSKGPRGIALLSIVFSAFFCFNLFRREFNFPFSGTWAVLRRGDGERANLVGGGEGRWCYWTLWCSTSWSALCFPSFALIDQICVGLANHSSLPIVEEKTDFFLIVFEGH